MLVSKVSSLLFQYDIRTLLHEKKTNKIQLKYNLQSMKRNMN